jgi:hypothetical protein
MVENTCEIEAPKGMSAYVNDLFSKSCLPGLTLLLLSPAVTIYLANRFPSAMPQILIGGSLATLALWYSPSLFLSDSSIEIPERQTQNPYSLP